MNKKAPNKHMDLMPSLPADSYETIPCGECDRETRHKVLARTGSHWGEANGLVDIWRFYKIVQCQGCMTTSFSEEYQCSEEMDYDPDTGEPYLPTTRKIYPSRIAGRPIMRQAHLLPHGVFKIYEEARGALCAKLNIMAGFGIRAIVEAVCKEKDMKGNNLERKIDSLAEAGHITKAGAAILHSLRFMGNAAVHEMKEHGLAELNTAFDVIEYLLHGVYVLPQQATQLRK